VSAGENFQAKGKGQAGSSPSQLAASYWVFRDMCHTLSECTKEKRRMSSAWKGLRAPLLLPLSSLSLSFQASTLMAAELWLLM